MLRPLKMIQRILFVLSLFLMFAGIAEAQSGADLFKKARRSLNLYNLDPTNNKSALDEAKTGIDEAFKYPDVQENPDAWISKGEIYVTFLEMDIFAAQVIGKPIEKSPVWRENDDLEIYGAFKKAFDLATKKYQKSDALRGLQRAEIALNNLASSAYRQEKFGKAYFLMFAVLQSIDLLVANGQKSILMDKESYEQALYFTALSALNAKRYRDALPLYEKLVNAGANKPEIYLGLSTVKAELGDAAGAEQILLSGREKFPDDTGLFFAAVNLSLQNGKFDELVEPLQQAIAKEPTNISLYITLGSVYEKLLTRERESGNTEAETQYFDEAVKIYQQALEKDPKNSDALYSLGSLYYNKAALLTKVEQTDAVVTEIMALFDQALLYFQKVESVNPNDPDTLTALQEIYVRKGDQRRAAEFKRRLEMVQRGGKNASSYFK